MKNEELIPVAIGLFVMAALVQRLRKWFMAGELKPNPWDQEVENAIQQPDALPLCHRCFAAQTHQNWFCPECGTATGPYNNWLPYVQIFSEGEILRNGTFAPIRFTPLTIAGYLIFSLGKYTIFAPVYWYFLFKNVHREADLPPKIDSGDLT